MPQQLAPFLLRYGFAVVSIALAIAVRLLLDPWLGMEFPFATVLLAVIATAWFGGFRPAFTALILGAIAMDFFLLPPRGSFGLTGAAQQVGMALFVLIGLGMAAITGSMHAMRRALDVTNAMLEQRIDERSKKLTDTKEKLNACEEVSRLMLQGVTSHAIVVLNPEGNVVTWNMGAERYLGYNAEEIVHQHFSRFYTPEDAASDKPRHNLRLAVEEGGFECEDLRVRKDGSQFWTTVTITPIYDGDPDPIGFVKVFQDITKRRDLIKALEEANSFNRATLDGLSAHIAILNESGAIIAVNRPWEAFGAANDLAPASATVGTNYLAVCDSSAGLDSEEGPILAAGIRAVLADETSQFELTYPCHSPAEQRWFTVRVTRFPGTVRHLIVAHENITGRMRAELALQESEQILRLFIEYAPASLAMLDDQMRYLAISRRAIADFGFESVESLLGLCHFDVFLDMPEQYRLEYRRALEGAVVGGEGEYTMLGRQRWLKWEARPWNRSTGEIGGIILLTEDITERKRIEAEQQNLIRLIELSGDFIATADTSGQITYMNASGRRMIGFGETDDLALLKYTDYVPTEWQKLYIGTVMELTREQGHSEGEMQLRHLQTGELIDVLRSNFLLVDASGQVVGYATVTRDVTQQKRAQEAVRASEEQLRLMIEGVSDHAIYMLNSEGHILTWSRGAEQIYGYTAQEITGRHYSCLFTAEDAANGLPMRELEVAATSGMEAVEGWRVRQDESRFWADGTLAVLYDENHNVKGFAKIIRDLTAKRHNEELLQSVLDHTLDGILGVDEWGTVTMINLAGEKLFGYTASEVIGQKAAMLLPDPYRSEVEHNLTVYATTGVMKFVGSGREVQGLRKDGSLFPTELSTTEFRLDNRLNFVSIVRDLSERKKLEAQFHQSQKMEAFGQLAGGVAHDFNNLLTVISGFSEIVMAKLSPDDEKRGMVQQIIQAGERATGLTQQLLAFSRQQVLEPKVLDINSVVTNTATMLRRIIGEDVQFETVLRPNLASVKIDPGQIEQVILNLAVNSRDAMRQGGKLTIETSENELDESFTMKHPGAIPGRFIQLAVSDTGIGMPAEVKARVFEPFFTTKGVGEGTGLGLAVVHGIVKQSGGIVDVYSEVGVGTTFKIYLPAVVAIPESGAKQETAIARGGLETILLVEDEKGVREFAAIVLRSFGYVVLEAGEADAAMRAIEAHRGTIHLLVTDVVMPGISGRELAESLQAQYPGLRVLFLSGYTDDSVVRHGVLRAEVAFLQKPFTPNSLGQMVRNILDQR